jgi:hypothetical protein
MAMAAIAERNYNDPEKKGAPRRMLPYRFLICLKPRLSAAQKPPRAEFSSNRGSGFTTS